MPSLRSLPIAYLPRVSGFLVTWSIVMMPAPLARSGSITATATYLVRAYQYTGAGGSTGTYQLGIDLENTSTPPTTGGSVVSETESNDTIATANDVSSSWRYVGYSGTTTGSLPVNNPNTGPGTNVVLNLSTTSPTTKGTLSGAIATPSSGVNTATKNGESCEL